MLSGKTTQRVLLQQYLETLSQNTITVKQKEMLDHFAWDLAQIFMLQGKWWNISKMLPTLKSNS